MAPLHYMTDEIQQFCYNEIKKQGSLENAVDNFWLNLLPDYFKKKEKFAIQHEARPLLHLTKQRADWTILFVKNGSPKKVVLLEDKRKGLETKDSAWRDALAQLTRYLKLVRTEQNSVEVLYGAVNIGTYTRFYELHPNDQSCIDYISKVGYQGEALEVLKDEVMVHQILLEIAEKTKH